MKPKHADKRMTYKDAGVDIDAGAALVERIGADVRRTTRPEVLAGLGGFGGLFELDLSRFPQPVLVSGTDGVGTKLLLARQLDRHDSIGIDLVAMCVNDIVVTGAEPLFFLDYFATGALDVDAAASVVAGIARGCRQAGCALIGGETAEMPGMYAAGDYDLAGFSVGAVNKPDLVDGQNIDAGDVVIGLAASGPHSNGYSLIRRIVEAAGAPLDAALGGQTLADALMAPTRIYVKPLLALLGAVPVKGLAHITGGGLTENLPRILPAHVDAIIDRGSWDPPPVFAWLQAHGNVADDEMLRTFNCGIGMCVVVAAGAAEAALARLTADGEQATVIGRCVAGNGSIRFEQ